MIGISDPDQTIPAGSGTPGTIYYLLYRGKSKGECSNIQWHWSMIRILYYCSTVPGTTKTVVFDMT